MSKVKIYQPAKNPMQSGKGKTKSWVLEFVPETSFFTEELMSWTGMDDTRREISLRFPTLDSATGYAEKNKLQYEVLLPKKPTQRKRAYADNFAFGRVRAF